MAACPGERVGAEPSAGDFRPGFSAGVTLIQVLITLFRHTAHVDVGWTGMEPVWDLPATTVTEHGQLSCPRSGEIGDDPGLFSPIALSLPGIARRHHASTSYSVPIGNGCVRGWSGWPAARDTTVKLQG